MATDPLKITSIDVTAPDGNYLYDHEDGEDLDFDITDAGHLMLSAAYAPSPTGRRLLAMFNSVAWLNVTPHYDDETEEAE